MPDLFVCFLFSAVFIAVVLGAHCLHPFKRTSAAAAFVFWGLGYAHFIGLLVKTELIYNFPRLYYSAIPVMFALGPALYFYFRLLIEEERSFRFFHWLHFLPALIAFGFWVPILYKPENELLEFIRTTINKETVTVYLVLLGLGLVWIIGYLCYTGWAVLYPGRPKLGAKQLGGLTAMGVLLLLISTAEMLGYGVASLTNQTDTNVFITLVLYVLLWVGLSQPDFMDEFAQSIRDNKYARSRLLNVDTNRLGVDLKQCMESDRLFLDENLTLTKLAAQLGVKPPQLSQFVNENYGINFNTFINRYRIEAAQTELLTDREASALSIAFNVGFNSASVFHDAFKKVTGTTPARFRKLNS